MNQAKFSWREWLFTRANENLYTLSPDELETYRLILSNHFATYLD